LVPSQGATQNVGPRPAHFCSLVPKICMGLFHNCILKKSRAAAGSPHLCLIILKLMLDKEQISLE